MLLTKLVEKFEPKEFINYLPYMGKGMLAILIVIGIIILATAVLNKTTGGKKK